MFMERGTSPADTRPGPAPIRRTDSWLKVLDLNRKPHQQKTHVPVQSPERIKPDPVPLVPDGVCLLFEAN